MYIVDLNSFIRQFLPPVNRRQPRTAGVIQVLFRPVDSLIEAFNRYGWLAKFDTGTPAQMFVLQYMLRELVHPNILVVDGNFASVDFRVLVPPALTNEENALVISTIERYRLHSRRYEVSVQADWGDGGPVGGLQWIDGYPNITPVEGGWVISYGIKQTGIYWDRVINETTGQTVLNSQTPFVGGGIYNRFITVPGVYSVRVGGLRATLAADNDGTICDLTYEAPPELEMLELTARVKIQLYSARPNIGPFTTRVYTSGNGLLTTVQHDTGNGWVEIPQYPDGDYKVDTSDRFGCRTQRATIHMGRPLAWVDGYPRVEDRMIKLSVTQSGSFPVYVGLATGGVAPEIDEIMEVEAFSSWGTVPVSSDGVYLVKVGPLEATVTVTGVGVTCDLTYEDIAIPSSPQSVAFRDNGTDQELYIALYSGRAGLSPFWVEIRNSSNAPVESHVMAAPGTWFLISGNARLAPGTYRVQVTDNQGCKTIFRDFIVPDTGGPVGSPLAVGTVGVGLTGGVYTLSVPFSGGSGTKTIEVVGTGGLIISVTGVQTSPRAITLPSGTTPQTVIVRVTDSTGTAERGGVVLPNPGTPGTGTYKPVRFSEGNHNFIEIEITGTPGDWRISDKCTYVPPAGYERYYRVGNKLIRQVSPLQNEPYQSNMGVSIQVFFVKPSVPSIVYWHLPLFGGGAWGDANGGIVLPKGDLGAYESFLFLKQ